MSPGGTFASLRVRNYRLYWSGQLVSQLGTWMRLIAMSWLVLVELGGGGTAVGLVAAAQFAPTLVLGTWAGVLADRRSPRSLLVVTQSAMAVVGSALAVLMLTGSIQLWMVFVLSGASGVIVAFDNPARQSLVGELVGPRLIANAVALNSMGFNGARIVGPAIAGACIQLSGTGLCFALNAASYIAALGGVLTIRESELHQRERVARAKGQVREGLRYAASVPVLRSTLLTMAVVGTISMNFTVLVPVLARTTFSASASTFGLLSAAMGAGSLLGSLRIARRTDPTLSDLAAASFALAVSMTAVAVSPGFVVGMVALALTGACVITFLSTTNSLLQLNSRSDMRGRVLALYLVLFIGTSPIGSPIVGWIAERYGVRASVVVGAVGAAIGGLVAVRRREAHGEAPQLEGAIV